MILIWKSSFRKAFDPDELCQLPENASEFYAFLRDLPQGDPTKLLALQPDSIRQLLDCETITIGELFHVAEDIVVLNMYVIHQVA